MKSLHILVSLLSLVLFANFTNGRKDSGEHWQGVVQENIQSGDCHTSHEPSIVKGDVSFMREFKPKPIAKAFTINLNHETSDVNDPTSYVIEPSTISYADSPNPKGEMSFVRDFGPKPIAKAFTTDQKHMTVDGVIESSNHNSNGEISFVRDFEPKSIARAFTTGHMPKGKISFVRDFEPKPIARAFTTDHMPNGEISFVRDFEPKPIARAFTTDHKPNGEVSFVRDFEPKPIDRAFTTDHKPNGEISFVRDFKSKPIARAFTTDNKHMAPKHDILFVRDFEPNPIIRAFIDHNYKTSYNVIGSSSSANDLKPQVEKSYTDDSQLEPNVSPI